SSAIPRNALACCKSSSTPAATRSACPAISTTRRPNVSGGWCGRSSRRTIGDDWRRELRFLRGDLRGEHPVRRLEVDQRIDVELGRDDIGPFIQDTVQHLIALDIEHRDRTA